MVSKAQSHIDAAHSLCPALRISRCCDVKDRYEVLMMIVPKQGSKVAIARFMGAPEVG